MTATPVATGFSLVCNPSSDADAAFSGDWDSGALSDIFGLLARVLRKKCAWAISVELRRRDVCWRHKMLMPQRASYGPDGPHRQKVIYWKKETFSGRNL
jgi:hypothetical protein